MPGKKFRLIRDSVHQKRPIEKSHNGRERKCATLARVFRPYWRPHCENPDSSQHYDFQIALKCVSALVDFSLMAQYRSHTPDTLSYLERYLLTFHQTKDIVLEFRTSKATRAEANPQDRELRELIANERAHEIRRTSTAKRGRQADQERLQRVNQRADFICRENHINFIKMDYLSHFSSHVRRFGSISMYSTEIGERAYKDQMKEGYRRSNKNEAARQILSHYGRQHALGMRLQTLDVLFKAENVVAIEGTGGRQRLHLGEF